MAVEIPVNRSKIIVPSLRPEVIHRERLLVFLDELLEKKLLLITAPAGYGKTTLLIDMAHSTEMPVCWLALDTLDRDPQRFIAYLIAALTQRFPRFGRQSMEALKRLTSFEQDSEQLLATLINEVYDQVDQHFILILDDFQFVDSVREITGFLSRFVHLCADHCHVVLSSRRLPALPDIALLVARQQVIGFDLEELSFRPDEVRQLFEKNYAVRLDDGMVEQLMHRTEGWITGLHLSAPAASGGLPDLSRAARAVGVDLADYFDGQVLAPQPPGLRSFLLQTSLLEEFDASLCTAVLGRGDWKKRIEEAKRGNLFVLPVGPRGNSIRYHHLFQDFLQERFLNESPARAAKVLARLAQVYEERGDWEKAFQISHQQGNIDALAGLIERAGTPMLINERLLTLKGWLDSLPDGLARTRPALLSLKGAFLCALGNGTEALALLDEAVRGFRTAADLPGLTLALVRRSAALRVVGDYTRAVEDAEEALGLSRGLPDLAAIYAEAARFKGLSLFRLGQASQAARFLQESLQGYEQLGEAQSCARLQMELGQAYRAIGNTAAARRAYEQALAEWRRMDSLRSQANVLNSLGVLYHAQGEFEAAVRLLEEGLEAARRGGSPWQQGLLLSSLGDIYLDLDAFEAAGQAYDQAAGIASQVSYQFLTNYVCLAQARLARLRGQPAEARRRLEMVHDSIQPARSNYESGLYFLESGCLHLVDGSAAQAVSDIQAALEYFRRGDLAVEILWSRVWLAAAHLQAGAPETARDVLPEEPGPGDGGQLPYALVQAVRRTRRWLAGLVGDPLAGERLTAWLQKADQIERRFPAVHKSLRQTRASVPLHAAGLVIRALGRAQVRRDGRLVTTSQWQTASVRDLFFYFLSRERPVTKEEVGEAFWPDADPKQLKLRFKNDLYRLRRALGSEVILFENEMYSFNRLVDYEYDVEIFEDLLGRAGKEQDPGGKVEQLRAAVRLRDGPYLQDVDADWVPAERERLERLYLEALHALAGLLRQQGRLAEALLACQHALQADPCQEDFHRLAMELYAARGDRPAVIRQYQACRDALRSELDVEPSPETEAFYRRLSG